MSDQDPILIWTEVPDSKAKSALPSLSKGVQRTVELSADLMADNLRHFLDRFQRILDQGQSDRSGFRHPDMQRITPVFSGFSCGFSPGTPS